MSENCDDSLAGLRARRMLSDTVVDGPVDLDLGNPRVSNKVLRNRDERGKNASLGSLPLEVVCFALFALQLSLCSDPLYRELAERKLA